MSLDFFNSGFFIIFTYQLILKPNRYVKSGKMEFDR